MESESVVESLTLAQFREKLSQPKEPCLQRNMYSSNSASRNSISKHQRRFYPQAGAGDAATVNNHVDLFKGIGKVFIEEVKKALEESSPTTAAEPSPSEDAFKQDSEKLDEDLRGCLNSIFPNAFVSYDSYGTELDIFSLNESADISKLDIAENPEEEESLSSIPVSCGLSCVTLHGDFQFGTLTTHEDAERRLNVHIAAWFRRHIDQGSAFDNILRDYMKLKSMKSNLNGVPYLSFENDTTTKEAFKIRASRINPEDYRGMRFVMCDNPQPDSYEDFWRLVWRERARAVVNLRFEALEDKECYEYWPTRQNPVMQFGDFIIKFRGVRYKTSFIDMAPPGSDSHVYRTTSLSIYNTKKIRIRPGNVEHEIDHFLGPRADRVIDDEYLEYFECHSIKHICFERWPDLLLPIPWGYVNSHSDMAIVLSEHVLKQELRNHQRFRGPVIVHAPVGNSRPLCLIALKHSLARLYFDRVVDVSVSFGFPRTLIGDGFSRL